jgi:uncharacterized repeat protein (TIGR01451 family)
MHTYPYGTVVNVTAIPATGYAFDHWSGACSGAGACSVTMDADKSVTAHFKLTPNPNELPPDLSLTKQDGGTDVKLGDTIAYLLTYYNTGGDATGVVITETVPANTTFNSTASTSGWVCQPDGKAGSTCTFNLGSVTYNSGASVIFAVTVNSHLPMGVTEIHNTAEIGDDGTNGVDSNLDNNTDSVHTTIQRYMLYLPFITSN